MPNQGTLPFGAGQDQEALPPASKAPAHGLLATNHLNLMFALSAGMVMPPAGYGEKYYRDTLSRYPGWIPLFVKKPFASAIEEAASEAKHLIPCVARIRLDKLAGPVAVVRDNTVTQVDFRSEADKAADRVILVPAPLPTSWIKEVYFQSKQENKRARDRAKDYGNVSFEGIKRLTKPHYFKGPDQSFPEDSKLGDLETPLGQAGATGGILGMLVQMGNLGDVGLRTCRLAFGSDEGEADQDLDPILLGLGPWLRSGQADERPTHLMDAGAAQLLKWLFWGSVDRLLRHPQRSAKRTLLDFLDEVSDDLRGRPREKMLQLRIDLEALTGLSDSSAEELFARHPKPFSRALVLFFLISDCDELLRFRHDTLHQVDYLCAAILFGASAGWMGLPPDVREIPGLAKAVSDRMAAAGQRLAATGIGLGEPAGRCRPLREIFAPDGLWTRKLKSSALQLAQTCGWNCLRTTLRLAQGKYAMRIRRATVEISWSGSEKALTTDVDRAAFLERLAQGPIPLSAEKQARKGQV